MNSLTFYGFYQYLGLFYVSDPRKIQHGSYYDWPLTIAVESASHKESLLVPRGVSHSFRDGGALTKTMLTDMKTAFEVATPVLQAIQTNGEEFTKLIKNFQVRATVRVVLNVSSKGKGSEWSLKTLVYPCQ